MPRPCAPRSDDLKLPRGSKVAIGFIGLGNIGKPMAKHLLKLGEPVWVCDVAATPVAELVTAGAHAAANPRTLATQCRVIGLCVRYDADVEARSEERRVGKECVSTCRSRWSTYP